MLHSHTSNIFNSTTMKHQESKTQIECVKWFKLQYPKLAPLLFAVPNGGHRNAREASIMKQEGITKGVADLILLIPNKQFHALCIEMKTINNKQTITQIQWQTIVQQHGYKYIVCHSFDEFYTEVKNYLKNNDL
jgi:hypothetical protein